MSRFILLLCFIVVVVQGDWINITPRFGLPGVAFDISCVDSSDCYMAGGDNSGNTAMVYRFNGSQSGVVRSTNLTAKGDLILMTVAMEGSSGSPKGVAAGLSFLNSGIYYATDPDTFTPAGDGLVFIAQSQNARIAGSNALVMMVGSGQGVAYSGDYGVTFTNFIIPIQAPGGGANARYGAIVDANTWYVAFGAWPENSFQSLKSSDFYPYSAKYAYDRKLKKLVRKVKAPVEKPSGGYSAMIVKTSDGGKTWEKQYANNSTFYFNAIDCFDANNCAAVAEGFDQDAGVKVFQTTDGKTWNEVFSLPSNPGSDSYTFMAVRYTSAANIWVGGGHDQSLEKQGVFYKSTDGGKTFALDSSPLDNIDTVTAMDFTTGGTGFAVGLSAATGGPAVLRYNP